MPRLGVIVEATLCGVETLGFASRDAASKTGNEAVGSEATLAFLVSCIAASAGTGGRTVVEAVVSGRTESPEADPVFGNFTAVLSLWVAHE